MPKEKIKCFFVEPTGKEFKRECYDDEGKHIGTSYDREFRRTDTGELFVSLSNAPVGAMWFADWLDDMFSPQLEHVLVVKTPGGEWVIDSQARNCTNPTNEFPRQEDHHCWIIHGTPPEITVDKKGVTCGAGAGSIGQETYHGFLRNGYLEEC